MPEGLFYRPLWGRAIEWCRALDPGGHGRIKGLRLVAAYALAALIGSMVGSRISLDGAALLAPLAGAFALWASVSEGSACQKRASRDLFLLAFVAALSGMVIAAVPIEAMLIPASFLVGYLRRFGRLGTGLGSQIFIGMALTFSYGIGLSGLPVVLLAGVIAIPSAVIPRLLWGQAERGEPFIPIPPNAGPLSTALMMGLQGALPATIIIALTATGKLTDSVWAITACTYVVAASSAATIDRIRHRVIGTAVGVAVGLACVPMIESFPLLMWAAAAAAIVGYAVTLPRHYDLACGAFAFTLMITMAHGGGVSAGVLQFRIWETLLGCGLGFATAKWLLPLRPVDAGS